ncbi:MAG: CHAD domain-containing protein [Thermomicrobiales bacterium]
MSESSVERAVQGSLASERFCPIMRDRIGERWADVWAAAPVAIEGTDPEGVHQVRVASRRLRAAMDVAIPCFSPSWYRPLHRTAKDLTGALGDVRDLDVLRADLLTRRESASEAEQAGIARLIARLDTESVRARAAMEAYLRGLVEGDLGARLAKRFGPGAAPPVSDIDIGRDEQAGAGS